MHFLTTEEARGARALHKPWAFVKVRFERGRSAAASSLVIDGAPMICKGDTLVVDLPERWRVCASDGTVVKPSKGARFVVTVETIDPYHAVAEIR